MYAHFLFQFALKNEVKVPSPADNTLLRTGISIYRLTKVTSAWRSIFSSKKVIF